MKWNNGDTTFGSKWNNGDIIGFAVNLLDKTFHLSVNGSYESPNGLAF